MGLLASSAALTLPRGTPVTCSEPLQGGGGGVGSIQRLRRPIIMQLG